MKKFQFAHQISLKDQKILPTLNSMVVGIESVTMRDDDRR